MGQNSQKRRAEKKKRRADRRSSGGGGRSSGWRGARSWDDRGGQIELLAISGASAAANRLHEELDATCAALVRCSETMGARLVTTSIGVVFCGVLGSVWDGGWQPLEIARQVRRVRRGCHGELLSAAMGAPESWADASGAMPEAWALQLRTLGVEPGGAACGDWVGRWIERSQVPLEDSFKVILEALGVLMVLPAIEPLLAPPCEWSEEPAMGQFKPDDPVLSKIRALLAKAESTSFEAESEALTAKAQELMARHAIDDALARAERSSDERPIARRLAVDDPYASAKSHLLQVIADANGVRAVWYDELAMMAVVGFAADVEAVELLFTSLLVQASRAMLSKGSVSDGGGRSRTRSFRQSFLLAFAGRIRERLVVAAANAQRDAQGELGSSLLPVLARRDREVDDAVVSMFPHLVAMAGPTVSNAAGWRAGRTAAELATLGPEQGILDGVSATG